MARQSFGKYEVLARLATGGAASIFLARQPGAAGFQKLVVLKTLLPERASDQDFVRMFLDEARLAARLQHPNCVQIYDLGRVKDVYYISMEYIFGETLWNLLTTVTRLKTPLPPHHVAAIVANVCDGLHHAHELKDKVGKPLNLVHRDVSPQNVMVSFEGQTKVVDFGIAKAETDRPPTVAGIVKGKFSYMSPEQITGNPVDRRSDIYSLGIVMFECLASRRLYRGDTPEEIARLILEHRAPRLRDVVPEVPPALDEICARALARQPNRRFQTASAMAGAFREFLDSIRYTGGAPVISRLMTERFGEMVSLRRKAYEAALSGDYDESFLCDALGAKPVRNIDLFPEEPSTGVVARQPGAPAGSAVAPAEAAATVPDVRHEGGESVGRRYRGPGWQVELSTGGLVAPEISVMEVDNLDAGQTSDSQQTRRGPKTAELMTTAQPTLDHDRTRIDGVELHVDASDQAFEASTFGRRGDVATDELPTELRPDEGAKDPFGDSTPFEDMARPLEAHPAPDDHPSRRRSRGLVPGDLDKTVHENEDEPADQLAEAEVGELDRGASVLSPPAAVIPIRDDEAPPRGASVEPPPAMDVEISDTPSDVPVFGSAAVYKPKSLPPLLPLDDERSAASTRAGGPTASPPREAIDESEGGAGPLPHPGSSSASRVVRRRSASAAAPGGLGPLVSPVRVRARSAMVRPSVPVKASPPPAVVGGVSVLSEGPAVPAAGSVHGGVPALSPVPADHDSAPRRFTLAAVLAALGFGLAIGIIVGLSIARLVVLSTPRAGTVIKIPDQEY